MFSQVKGNFLLHYQATPGAKNVNIDMHLDGHLKKQHCFPTQGGVHICVTAIWRHHNLIFQIIPMTKLKHNNIGRPSAEYNQH